MRTSIRSSLPAALRATMLVALSIGLLTAFQAGIAPDAEAKKRKRGNPKYAAIVVDAKTGKVLHASNANARRYPASLTKMMTLYLVFEDLKAGRITKSSRLVMTKAGARRPPSKIGLRVGKSISMEQAILSLVTKSANDVSTAIGDKLSGSEAAFARRMTRKARQLGMKGTQFKNANGLTARGQYTTAADMAKLGMALREHFPREYKYFKTRVFKFGRRRYGNHNRLLGRVRGVDGIKTGYTRASGFNLVSSVSHGGRSIVAVVMGGRTGARRNRQMQRLIARYLPKASRGASRPQIARPRSSGTSKVALAKVTTPTLAKRVENKIASRIDTAHAASQSSPAEIASVRTALLAIPTAQTPKPSLRKGPLEAIDHVTTATVPAQKAAPSGWQVQIAATDDRGAAHAMLDKVRAKNRRLLSGTSDYTQRIVKRGSVLYRARFAGFRSKTSARRACRKLKARRINCLAIAG